MAARSRSRSRDNNPEGENTLPCCPNTMMPFEKPVVAADGFTYEYDVITLFFASKPPPCTGPMRIEIGNKVLIRNWQLISPLGNIQHFEIEPEFQANMARPSVLWIEKQFQTWHGHVYYENTLTGTYQWERPPPPEPPPPSPPTPEGAASPSPEGAPPATPLRTLSQLHGLAPIPGGMPTPYPTPPRPYPTPPQHRLDQNGRDARGLLPLARSPTAPPTPLPAPSSSEDISFM